MGKSQENNIKKFLEYADKNKGLTRTSLYKSFVKSGGHVQKKAGLQALREHWNLEKGEARRVTIKDLNKGKRKYISKAIKGRVLPSRILSYSREESKGMLSKMEKLYNHKIDSTIAVNITVNGDNYTNDFNHNFRFFLTKKNFKKDNFPVFTFLKTLTKTAVDYYSNLEKLYNGTYSKVKEQFLNAFNILKNKSELTKYEAFKIYKENGINIKDIEDVRWV